MESAIVAKLGKRMDEALTKSMLKIKAACAGRSPLLGGRGF